MAMESTFLILGLQPEPEVNLHDGIIVFYLLFVSTITVYLCSPSYNHSSKFFQYLSIIQNYTFFVFTAVLLIMAETFGSSPTCNHRAVIVLFQPFLALPAGRIVGSIGASILLLLYSWITIRDYLPAALKRMPLLVRRRLQLYAETKTPLPRSKSDIKPNDLREDNVTHLQVNSRSSLNVAWPLVVRLVVVLILWTIDIINTELLIRWSNFAYDQNSHSMWQFGQVLPLFLVIIPLVGMTSSFHKHGLRLPE